MAMNYTDEDYHQLTIEEMFEPEERPNLFGVSILFAEARKQMSIAEYKAFAFLLSRHDWTQPCPIYLFCSKQDMAQALGIKSDDPDHMSENLMRMIGRMHTHCSLEFKNKAKGIYNNGCFITNVITDRKVFGIKFNDSFVGLFGSLNGIDNRYITMLTTDVLKLSSLRAVLFYEFLRSNSDTRLDVNTGIVGIRKLKELFEIPKDGPGSYMTQGGHFKRTHFEEYVINPACAELVNTEMIKLLLTPDGSYYTKVYRGKYVIGYQFTWEFHQDVKPRLEAQDQAQELPSSADSVTDRPLWESALEAIGFTREEIEAVGSRLRLVRQEDMMGPGPDLEVDRYHLIDMLIKDLLLAEKRHKIKDRCRYLIRMIERKYLERTSAGADTAGADTDLDDGDWESTEGLVTW